MENHFARAIARTSAVAPFSRHSTSNVKNLRYCYSFQAGVIFSIKDGKYGKKKKYFFHQQICHDASIISSSKLHASYGLSFEKLKDTNVIKSKRYFCSSGRSYSENKKDNESDNVNTNNSKNYRGRGSSRSHRESEKSREYSSGFINSVFNQVKLDMANNPELQKAVEDFRKSQFSKKSQNISSCLHSTAISCASTANHVKTTTYSAWNSIHDSAGKLRTLAIDKWYQQSKVFNDYADTNENARKAWDFTKGVIRKMIHLKTQAISKLKLFTDDDSRGAEKKAMRWRQQMAIRRYKAQQNKQEDVEGAEKTDASDTKDQHSKEKHKETICSEKEDDNHGNDALVLTHPTAWDRFGSKLRDMPFLHNFYENPVFHKLFGETEIAAAIREMKEIDKSFTIYDLHELVEEVIAEHIVQAFLVGDEDTLKIHCSPVAFSVLNASIKERKLNKVVLEPKILHLQSVELIGARSCSSLLDSPEYSSKEACPWFIYTFEVQQINCLKCENTGEVVEGRIDDIRRVVYSVVLTKHPVPETEGLHYPYMVKEVAIIGSEAVW